MRNAQHEHGWHPLTGRLRGTRRQRRTMLGLTAIAVVAAVGCGGSSHKSTSSVRTAPASTTAAAANTTAGTRPSTFATVPRRTTLPALILRTNGQVVAFVKLMVKGHPYLFLVDTGALRTQVDSAAARTLRLRHRGPATKESSLCRVSTQPVELADWKLGDTALPARTVGATRTAFSNVRYKGIPFGGSLGSDVLSQLGQMTLDLAAKRITVGGRSPRGGRTVPLKIGRADGEVAVVVAGTISDKPVGLLVDTGAGRTLLDPQAVKRLGLSAAGPTRTTHTAFCSKSTITPVRIAHWTVGGVPLASTIAISSPIPVLQQSRGKVFGLLGLDVLYRFHTVTIDYTDGRMVLGGTAR